MPPGMKPCSHGRRIAAERHIYTSAEHWRFVCFFRFSLEALIIFHIFGVYFTNYKHIGYEKDHFILTPDIGTWLPNSPSPRNTWKNRK